MTGEGVILKHGESIVLEEGDIIELTYNPKINQGKFLFRVDKVASTSHSPAKKIQKASTHNHSGTVETTQPMGKVQSFCSDLIKSQNHQHQHQNIKCHRFYLLPGARVHFV